MLHWIVHLVSTLGYLGVGILMAIENVVLPLPSELIMPLAGFSAANRHMTLWGAILAGTVGSVVGAIPIYAAARGLGEERISGWIERHGRWLFLSKDDIKKADRSFKDRGSWAVIISQLLPGVRSLIALPAGFARMNISVFLLANFIGTLVWCAVLSILGNILGAHYDKVHQVLGPVTWVVLGVVMVGVAFWIIRRRRHA